MAGAGCKSRGVDSVGTYEEQRIIDAVKYLARQHGTNNHKLGMPRNNKLN